MEKKKIEAINTCAVAILRYGAGILDLRIYDLKELGRLRNF